MVDLTSDQRTCPFCDPAPSEILLANDLAYARFDLYPVSPGHLLLITNIKEELLFIHRNAFK